jgi:hypothetical protein
MAIIDNAVKHFESLEIKKIEVPEWGDGDEPLVIYSKPITLSETSKLYALAKDNDVEMLAYVLIYKALDEEGNKIFSLADKKALMEKVDRDVLIRVSSAITGEMTGETVQKK